MAPPPQIPSSVQQPRMVGMASPLLHQSMTPVSSAMGQTRASMAGQSKVDPNHIPRPVPSSPTIMHETRQGNQANPPPVCFWNSLWNNEIA